MRSSTRFPKRNDDESAVSSMVEYLSCTGVLMVMLIMMIIVVNGALMEGPANTLKYHAFVDIGNGVSTRIVDLYVIAPGSGEIITKFDLPDDVAGSDYMIELEGVAESQRIVVTDGSLGSRIAIGGIGATRSVTGSTTGGGLNVITYNSSGV